MTQCRHFCPDPGVGWGGFAQTFVSPSELLEHWALLSKDPVLAGPALLQGHLSPAGSSGKQLEFP